MKTILYMALFGLIFSSCSSSKVVTYLKDCEKTRNEQKETYCPTSVENLKTKLPTNDVVYYLGTDSEYHYLKYHYRTMLFSYDKTAKWAVMGFKIEKQEYEPAENIDYNEMANKKDNYPIKVKDL